MSDKLEEYERNRKKRLQSKGRRMSREEGVCTDQPIKEIKEIKPENKITNIQWSFNENVYRVVGQTTKELPPGFYAAYCDERGPYLKKLKFETEGLLEFPETNSKRIVSEIENFWLKEDVYRQHKIQYKRGIIMWGPPGSGKALQ